MHSFDTKNTLYTSSDNPVKLLSKAAIDVTHLECSDNYLSNPSYVLSPEQIITTKEFEHRLNMATHEDSLVNGVMQHYHYLSEKGFSCMKDTSIIFRTIADNLISRRDADSMPVVDDIKGILELLTAYNFIHYKGIKNHIPLHKNNSSDLYVIDWTHIIDIPGVSNKSPLFEIIPKIYGAWESD